jgi:hypothetical protein
VAKSHYKTVMCMCLPTLRFLQRTSLTSILSSALLIKC